LILAVASLGRAADPPVEAPPAVPTADARYAELGRLQARVEDSRRRLAEAEKKTASLEHEVEALDLRLELAQRQRELIAARRDDLARRGRALQQDLDTSQDARRPSLESFRGRVLLLSRLGRFGYFRLLLAARRTDDVFVAMKALDAMARADARELARFTDAGRRLASDLSREGPAEGDRAAPGPGS
jgi:septal ring factor EnvC (AmiA/AmiB activator)